MVFEVPYYIIAIGAGWAFLSCIGLAISLKFTDVSWLAPVFYPLSVPFLVVTVVYTYFSFNDTPQDVRSIVGRLVLAFVFYMVGFTFTGLALFIPKKK